ncbi:MAG: glycosyltransferase, partial [Spirochaetaceae bacterium]|nr:glycosyltransferase [Spirochaetaceae bacterium]
MPVVSVIMSVYNEPESILRSAVESILKQTFSDFEFIIVMDSP